MKTSVIKRAAFSVILFFLMLIAVTAIISAILFELRAGTDYIPYAAYIAAAIAAYAACKYSASKCGDPVYAPITAVTVTVITLLVNLLFDTENYSPPFIVPAICLTVGISVFLSGSHGKRSPRKSKYQKRKNNKNI